MNQVLNEGTYYLQKLKIRSSFRLFWLLLIFWDQYTVGGTSVTIPYGGLTDGAITISLNGESITIPGGSSIFEFPGTLVYDDDFEVNIVNYPPGQDCVVVNGVQVVTGNINNVEITCTASNGDNCLFLKLVVLSHSYRRWRSKYNPSERAFRRGCSNFTQWRRPCFRFRRLRLLWF